MAALAGSTPQLVSSYETREFMYRSIGFVWKLHYRSTWWKIYHTRVDEDGVDDYIASTPSGYTQSGYRNSWADSSPEGIHEDRFEKRETAWTNAEA